MDLRCCCETSPNCTSEYHRCLKNIDECKRFKLVQTELYHVFDLVTLTEAERIVECKAHPNICSCHK